MVEIRLLGNPAADGVGALLQHARDFLASQGADVRVLHASTPDDAADAARSAVVDGIDRLVAVGGDGVVSLAVNAVAESRTVLGIVPSGTGNDFARALGLLDGDADARIRRACEDPCPVDAIRTNHGWVASVATIGFSGDVTARANALRWPRGQQRYTVATFLELPRAHGLDVVVRVDGEQVGGHSMLLAIGNTAYFGGGMQICPGARPGDGRLQVVSVGDVSRLRFARNFTAVFSGRHVERDEVSVASGVSATVEGDDIVMWADGEPLGPLPVRLDVVPGAVRVAGARWSTP